MLSIIIPVYNQRNYTKSILAQIPLFTVSKYEIIVVDSASTDETPTEIKNHTNIRYIRPDKNIFVNGAWNLGVKEAKGEYICIMNNDLELTQWRDKPLIDNIKDNILITSPLYTIWDIPFNWRWFRNNPRNWYNICGHCFVMRKEDWTEIPERLKIWYWDNWQYEHIVRKKGIELCVPDSKIHHYESKTVKSKNKLIDMIIAEDNRQRKLFAEDYFKNLSIWK